jgi:energy-coupling factor transport system ATP-binding protein
MTSIAYRDVTFAYPDAPPALVHFDAVVGAGSFTLVVGASGSGKSTLLRAANGLVPHATGGTFSGDVVVGDRSTKTHHPRDLVDVVGFVHQDPEAQFVVDHVEGDLAFSLENLGLAPVAMRRRVEEVLDALAIAHLRDRDPATLSGGEKQRCAIAGAIVAAPNALVLDEPTSQLDPQGADDVIAALVRLNHDLGTTILMAEHRLERVAAFADDALMLERGNLVERGAPRDILRSYSGAPTVTQLGAVLGWDPLPLTVRDAQRHAATTTFEVAVREPNIVGDECLVSARGLRVEFDGHVALAGIDLDVRDGSVIAVLGRNGSGKTTLLRTLSGLIRSGGGISRTRRVGYVPQNPNDMLHAQTVREELRTTVRLVRSDPALVEHWLQALGLADHVDRHPRDLSGGERQRVAIAAVAVGGPAVLALDEPTRGMDADSRVALIGAIRAHAEAGGAVVLATHDVELAAHVATEIIVLASGDVIAKGEPRDVLVGSMFAPPLLRFAPPALTLDDLAIPR